MFFGPVMSPFSLQHETQTTIPLQPMVRSATHPFRPASGDSLAGAKACWKSSKNLWCSHWPAKWRYPE